jgi:hypothetical protein
MAAQGILANHASMCSRAATDYSTTGLAQSYPEHWPNMEVDLGGAVLVDWNFNGAELAGGVFAGTSFVGRTTFNGGTISW